MKKIFTILFVIVSSQQIIAQQTIAVSISDDVLLHTSENIEQSTIQWQESSNRNLRCDIYWIAFFVLNIG